jgi:hypothetical protein
VAQEEKRGQGNIGRCGWENEGASREAVSVYAEERRNACGVEGTNYDGVPSGCGCLGHDEGSANDNAGSANDNVGSANDNAGSANDHVLEDSAAVHGGRTQEGETVYVRDEERGTDPNEILFY